MEPQSLHKMEIEEKKPQFKVEHWLTPHFSLIRTTARECQEALHTYNKSCESEVTAFAVESTSNLEVPKKPQSIPAVPELLHSKNIKNAELNIQGSKLIITRIWNSGKRPEVEVFWNFSEEEYDYILNIIGCDNNLVCNDQSYHLRIPNMLLMLQICNADILPFWPFEISVTQSSEAAIAKLQRFGDQNDNILAVTHIHITEAQKHAVEKGLDKRGVQMRELMCSEDSGFASLSHTWCHPVTVTISTWICPPGGQLDLKSQNSRHHVTAILYPDHESPMHVSMHAGENL
ncbi:hypothetical protein BDR04DRAFT_1123642 [Suillus decipiens]|nr:hypothetical protein BDR04DRAFT_1123642 [Suillus decipiens]